MYHHEKSLARGLHAGHGFLDSILGRGYKRNAQGLVISKCGAPAQRWHVDSSHLFPTMPGLPCHFVTVFCPLYQAHKARQTFGGKLEVWELWWETLKKITCRDKQIKRTGVRLECCLSLQNITVSEFNYHCILNIAQCVIYIYTHT